jgi:hypothetical protein
MRYNGNPSGNRLLNGSFVDKFYILTTLFRRVSCFGKKTSANFLWNFVETDLLFKQKSRSVSGINIILSYVLILIIPAYAAALPADPAVFAGRQNRKRRLPRDDRSLM